MPSRRLIATFGAGDPARAARFWAELLGRQVAEDSRGLLLPGYDGQLALRFAPSRADETGPHRMHLHLTSETVEQQRTTVAAALRLGAQHIDVGQLDDEEHVVLADPAGNEFCVLEPEQDDAGPWTLVGCGFLGELACDGSHDVGRFWSRAMEWPLVWDHGEETAIEPPQGGTRVSWGGSRPPPGATLDRPHLEVLLDGDGAVEAERLLALGATRLEPHEDGCIPLADPDGCPFCLVTQ